MPRSHQSDPAESELLAPVLRLFPKCRFVRLAEAAVGQKRIDLLCCARNDDSASGRVAVELKVRDWRRATWQAHVNLQVAQHSYVAIWHAYAHLPRHAALRRAGVGLIVVGPRGARIVLESEDRVFRVARELKRDFYAATTMCL